MTTVRTPWPGTPIVTNDVPTAAQLNSLPGGVIAHAKVTADQSSITTVVDLTGLTATFTPDASRFTRIDFRLRFENTNVDEEIQVLLMQDGSQIDRFDFPVARTATHGFTVSGLNYYLLSNASTTIKLQAGRGSGGSGTITMKAGSTFPAVFFITDGGPSS